MRPEDGRDAAVGKMAERHLLARRLGVKIDQDRRRVDAELEFSEQLVQPGERIVERIHEEPAHQIDDENALLADRMKPPVGAGRSLWKVRRAQHPRIPVEIGDDLTLVPDVIAGGQHIDFGIVKFAAEALGQAPARRRVLGIDDDQVEGEPTTQGRHVLFYGLTAGPSDNIATKQDFHTAPRREIACGVEPARPSACNSSVARRSRWATMCRSHDSGRDGPQEVGIGPGATCGLTHRPAPLRTGEARVSAAPPQ